MPISPIDSINPAFLHTKQQLLQPFRAAQWAKLALVGMLAGEMSSGGCSTPNFRRMPSVSGGHPHIPGLGFPPGHTLLYAGLIAVVVVAGLIIFLALAYISSMMRFVLFDAVVSKKCEIGESWKVRRRPGARYFIWHMLFSLVTLGTLTILIGVPATLAFAAGWLKHPREHLLFFVLGGIVLFFIFLLWLLATVVIQVLTKDFVVPQMALEDLGPIQAWKRLLPMIKAEVGNFAGYLGMKFVMNIGAAIVLGIITLIAILIIAIPVGGIGVVAVLIGKAAGLTFNVFTITLLVIAGSILLALFLGVIALISVPAAVFFPAYSNYFFSSRYPPLDRLLHPSWSISSIPPPAVPPGLDPAY